MRTRLVVSFFICFLLQACSGASTTKTNGVSNTSGNDQAGCIALDTIGIDGAVEKFVWNEEDGIGFLIQDNSYLDFIKSSFTSRPVFAMQAADGRITYSTEDLMKEMWPKERIEDPVSVVAWRPYIIRKSKCSTDFKRNDFLKKTKRTHWVRFVHLNSLIESCVFLYLWNSPFDTFL